MTIQKRFSELPTTANAQMSDILCAVQGYISPSSLGLTVQETLQQVYNLFQANIILFNAGNPNGVLAGKTYQFCWDTVGLDLYICTTTGTTTTAIWTKIADSNLAYVTSAIGTANQVLVNGTFGTPQTGAVTFSLPEDLPINTPTTTWLPVFNFLTPGDLSVVYTKQAGTYAQLGSMVMATFEVACTPTYTTASGDFRIEGLPIVANLPGNATFVGSVSLNGAYTLGTDTWVVSSILPGANFINFYSNQSNSSSTQFSTSTFTSGNAIGITGSIFYLQ